MQIPGLPSCLFLVYLLVFIPWMAIRSALRVDRYLVDSNQLHTSARERIWVGTALHLLMLLAMAWIVGEGFQFQPFFYPGFSWRSLGVAGFGFIGIQAAVYLVRWLVPLKTRLKSVIFRLMPQNRREWMFKIIAIGLASIAEEVAYRGVGYQILAYSLNNMPAAIAICSIAFAIAHWMQGWRSMLLILSFALILHGVVWATDTLVYAMGIHFLHNLLAGWRASVDAQQDDQAPIQNVSN